MSENAVNNKRIAKNAIYLYFRMILVLVVSLYTSRVILAELGVVDYGVYNVVAGVIVMFTFINSSMATSTQRFLTFELGKGDFESLKRTFSASLNIHIVIGLLILILAETIGLWFVNAKLVIPPERMFAANIAYQCTVLSFMLTITQVPYNASLISHEEMNVYAYMGILEALSKLGIALLLLIYGGDKLIFFSILMLAIHACLLLIYRTYCYRKYSECTFSLFWDYELYRGLTSFAGWNLFGSIAWVCRGQGLNILLNLFFGPTLNAAKGIADKVSNSVMGFIRNFNTAMNPQITKSYAVGDINAMEDLCYRGTKFAFILLFLIALPTMVNIDFILSLWLVEVPEYTAVFVILVMVDALLDVLLGTSQFITAIQATGNIKYYQIVVGIIIMLVIPIGYAFLYFGGSPESLFYVMIGISLVSGLARILSCKYQIGFSLRKLCLKVWIPAIGVVLLATPLPMLLKTSSLSFAKGWIGFVIITLLSVILVMISSWIVAFSKSERESVKAIIQKKLKKNV